MKILVIGSTGATGQLLVTKLLAQNHEVTALARKPEDITQKNPRLRVVQGDARDAQSIENAVAGQDAVMAAFGPRSFKADDVQEILMRHLVAAMKKHGVRRLVNLSAAGAGDSIGELPFFLRKVFMPILLGRVFADKARGEKILFESGLDYVNVRPGRLINQPARGGIKTQMRGKGLKLDMTREDLADFMIQQLSNQEWVRKSPLIGY